MSTIKVCAVMVMSAGMWVTASAGGSRSPEQLGAHWARVSDEAQIQLIVDRLRSGGGEGTVRKLVPANLATATQTSGHSLAGERGGTTGAVRTSTNVAAERQRGGRSSYSVSMQANAATVDFPSGEKLELQKAEGFWKVTGGSVPKGLSAEEGEARSITTITGGSGVSVGETFAPAAISREHSIGRLTSGVTRARIGRQLFGAPENTASYYSVSYRKSAPFVEATYIQFVLDPEWNRIVYGSMGNWIRTYTVQSPSGIAVDADGNVFVGEAANKRVLVLKLTGSGNDAVLQHRHQINNITTPTDIAINDNGTPFNTDDDFVYIADASQNNIYKYTGGAGRNSLVAVYEGFDSPTGIAVGRWNGANENILYVIDKIAKRIRVYDDEGTSLFLLGEYKGDYSQYFSSIKIDHFGHVYVVDKVNSRILKFTSSLDLLDAEGGDDTYQALAHIDIPFAKIVVEGEGSYWTGFNQLFAVERWDNGSGAQRRTLGVKMKNIEFSADADISAVRNDFILTDVSNVHVRIYDENKRLVRTLTSSWMVAGSKDLQWDRRDDEGTQVPPGTYRYEVGATSAYGGEPTISNTRFYLPLYYHEDCGSTNRMNDAHLVQGSAVAWGSAPSQTASEHGSSVQYRFTGLNPAGEYEVAAECAAGDGVQRLQELTADGIRVGGHIRVTANPAATGFMKLPQESYADGEVTIAVNRLAEGSAVVTQLWLKETGVGFNPQPIATVPSKYLLEQNFPNPFNPTTTIRYAIPEDAVVTLKVYNINGQEVATLVSEPKAAGKYEVTFDAKNTLGSSLSSGIYFYRVTAGRFTETRKMVLLR